MAAVEEHKPAEKRRALGRGLASLLPSGPPRGVPAESTPKPAPAAISEHGAPVAPPAAASSAAAVATVAQEPVTPAAAPGSGEPGRAAPGEAAGPGAAQEKALRTGVFGRMVAEIPLELIDENPYQTRKTFDPAALEELAQSIKASGLAQPVVVRPAENGRYRLVLGERRCRASKLAGRTSVPAIIRQLGNEQAAEMTIVENLQRQDLNCLEQGQAFARLSREFNLTQEQIAKRVGASRESVANHMRLLKLPEGVLALLNQGKLGFSEARVLLEALPHTTVETIESMAKSAAEGRLTVRILKLQVDRLVKPELNPVEPPPEKKVDPNVRDAERRLREALGMQVRVTAYPGNKGQVVIRYQSLADFDRILERLSRDAG